LICRFSFKKAKKDIKKSLDVLFEKKLNIGPAVQLLRHSGISAAALTSQAM
jgi:hypothetical protein